MKPKLIANATGKDICRDKIRGNSVKGVPRYFHLAPFLGAPPDTVSVSSGDWGDSLQQAKWHKWIHYALLANLCNK